MKIGYVRVSTIEQNTMRQEVLMERLGVEAVYIDKVSGKDTERPELKKMMAFVRAGDVVIVESFSRFARSTRDLLDLIEELKAKGVPFISQKESIDTNTPQGKFMLTVFGAMAELERESILQRQREGIDLAMEEGRMGRPRKALDGDQWAEIVERVNNGVIPVTTACKTLGISRATWYRRQWEKPADTLIDF